MVTYFSSIYGDERERNRCDDECVESDASFENNSSEIYDDDDDFEYGFLDWDDGDE